MSSSESMHAVTTAYYVYTTSIQCMHDRTYGTASLGMTLHDCTCALAVHLTIRMPYFYEANTNHA